MEDKKPFVSGRHMAGHAVSCDELPVSQTDDMARVIYRSVREFFSDPAVWADYEKWLAQYRASHGQTD